MIVGADHDHVAHAAEHAGRVRHGFAPAKLAGRAIEDQRGAAQLADRHIEADAGAGGVFLEDHRQRVASERRVGVGLALRQGLAGGFPVDGVGEHGGERVGASVGEIQEMSGHDLTLKPVRAELVEALHFPSGEGKPFDKLRANGDWT